MTYTLLTRIYFILLAMAVVVFFVGAGVNLAFSWDLKSVPFIVACTLVSLAFLTTATCGIIHGRFQIDFRSIVVTKSRPVSFWSLLVVTYGAGFVALYSSARMWHKLLA